MGTLHHPFLSIAGSENHSVNEKKNDQRSPYLKAILTGNRTGAALIRNIDSIELTDKNAASRYIKESSFLRKA